MDNMFLNPNEQKWGYVSVRDKAYIFYWLYYTMANVSKPTDRPLIIWLQGGPGCSSTGYGNFVQIGPRDVNLKTRESSWVHLANILFVDSPVGTGFSYVNDKLCYTQSDAQVVQDFVEFLKKLYDLYPNFKKVPLYIFSESYGGKTAAEIAVVVDQEWKDGNVDFHLTGVGFGAPWISPIDTILNYAPYLFNLGLVDRQGNEIVKQLANDVRSAIMDNFNYNLAFNHLSYLHCKIGKLTNFINPNNILNKQIEVEKDQFNFYENKEKLVVLMNSSISKAFSISKTWKDISEEVLYSLIPDFLKSGTHFIEKILNTTDIRVGVYNGQLDLKVNTPGTLQWVEGLDFKDKKSWDSTPRTAISVNGLHEGYVKKYGRFAFYWVNRAGHMVPVDNPSAMEYILRDLTNNFEV